ncbi:MAG TPA: MATE family efflux transporter [Candidatus Hydrogenedentes bacterium]|nr:MATE family efflux transporter [Candidatus Hydrogenedentota bacterium]
MTYLPPTESRWAGAREVMGMSGPIILGSLSYTLMQFVDQVIVSRLGLNELAAMGSAGVWSYVLGCLLFGIVGCVSTFVSQCYGRGDKENCARYTWQGIYLSLLAAVMAVALWPLSGPLFRAMHHSPEVTELELTFFRIRLFGYLPMAWATALASFFQGIGRPGVPMYAAIAANVVNLALNYGLVFGRFGLPRLEIAGSATATVLAMTFQAVLLQAVFMSGRVHAPYGSRRVWRFDIVRARELCRIGFFAGLTIFMDVANWAIFTSFIVGHFGAVSLAAHNAAIAFMHLCFMPALGINQGIAAIVGMYVGRGQHDTAASRTYTAMRIAGVYMFLLGLVFAFFGKGLVAFFFTQDPGVVVLGHKLLILAAIFQAFDAINIVALGALRGAGDTRHVFYLTLAFAYGFFLPLSLILAFPAGWGAVGAWIGATAYIIGLSGLLFRRFRSGRWREMDIFSSRG